MDTVTRQAIGLGVAMALIFGVASNNVAIAILLGALFGGGFFAYRRRRGSR
jgi:hypothetical protein